MREKKGEKGIKKGSVTGTSLKDNIFMYRREKERYDNYLWNKTNFNHLITKRSIKR